MSENSPSDIMLKLALMIFGLGFVSTPFLVPRIGLSAPPRAEPGAAEPCPDGLGVQPYCGSGLADSTILTGSNLIADFYGRRDTLLESCACDDSIRVLLATVPDPVSSQLATSFDTFIYSLSRAHEALGYVRDRFWFPWQVPSQAGLKSGTANPMKTPGVILFRTTDAPERPRLSLVYLVGETPTRGIHKDAFRAALRNVRQLRQGCVEKELRILGPFFSGSTQSLLLTLKPLRDSFPQIDIISGTASSDANVVLRGVSASFAATVHSNNELEAGIETVLRRMDIAPSRVARLVERGTSYGQGFDTAGGSGLTIPFPMSIATIREQFEAAASEAAKRGAKEGAELGSRVALTGEGPSRGGDRVPTFSQASVAGQELMFDQLARLLSQRRIRMVGLLATDIRDKLFLAKELHNRLPNLQFYTVESNILYLRPEYREATKGMVVISTYPLIPQFAGRAGERLGPTDGFFGVLNATLVSLGEDSQVTYPSGTSAGDSLRTPPVWVTVVGAGAIEPLTILRSAAYQAEAYTRPAAMRATVSAPPTRRMWLLLFIFIEILLLSGPLPRLIALARTSIKDRRFSPRSMANAWRGSLPPLAGQVGSKLRYEHRWYRAEARLFDSTGRLLLAAALVPVCIVLAGGADTPPANHTLTAVLSSVPMRVWLVAVIPFAVCLVVALLDMLTLPRQDLEIVFQDAVFGDALERALRAIFYLAVGCVLLWIAGLTYEIIQLPAEGGARALFWNRARGLSSLTSPILPIILVGLTCFFWCAWHRKRSNILWHETVFERTTTPNSWPPESGYQEVWEEMRSATLAFRCKLSLLTPNRRAFTVLVVMCLVAILVGMSVFHTQEAVLSQGLDAYFRKLLWFGIIGGFILTLISADRALQLWGSLKRFLVWTERLPLRIAFDRLPPQVSRLTQLTPVRPRWEVWRDWQEQRWRQLSNLAQPDSPEILETENWVDGEVIPSFEWAKSLKEESSESRFAAVAERLDHDWEAEPDSSVVADVALALKELKDVRPGSDSQTGSISTKIRQSASYRERLWMRAAEEYVAADIVDYVDWAINGLRWLALFLMGAIVCTTFLLFSYPLPQERFVGTIFLGVFLLTVGTLATLVIGMNRNPMMSRITGTQPGRVSWDRSFLTNILVLVGLPILSYLGAVVPGLGDIVFGWVEPLVRSLSR